MSLHKIESLIIQNICHYLAGDSNLRVIQQQSKNDQRIMFQEDRF